MLQYQFGGCKDCKNSKLAMLKHFQFPMSRNKYQLFINEYKLSFFSAKQPSSGESQRVGEKEKRREQEPGNKVDR